MKRENENENEMKSRDILSARENETRRMPQSTFTMPTIKIRHVYDTVLMEDT